MEVINCNSEDERADAFGDEVPSAPGYDSVSTDARNEMTVDQFLANEDR